MQNFSRLFNKQQIRSIIDCRRGVAPMSMAAGLRVLRRRDGCVELDQALQRLSERWCNWSTLVDDVIMTRQ